MRTSWLHAWLRQCQSHEEGSVPPQPCPEKKTEKRKLMKIYHLFETDAESFLF